MEYLIYLSVPKVEMLYSQLPPELSQQVQAELSASLGLVSAKLKSTPPPEVSAVHKAFGIEKHVQRTHGFGSVAQPRDWVRDEVDVLHVRSSVSPGLFALVGNLADTYFLIGGSARNVIGNSLSGAEVNPGLSYLPYMLEAISRESDAWEVEREAKQIWVDQRPKGMNRSLAPGNSGDEIASAIKGMYLQATENRAARMKVRFVGRHLQTESLRWIPGQASIFTPLFVALSPV